MTTFADQYTPEELQRFIEGLIDELGRMRVQAKTDAHAIDVLSETIVRQNRTLNFRLVANETAQVATNVQRETIERLETALSRERDGRSNEKRRSDDVIRRLTLDLETVEENNASLRHALAEASKAGSLDAQLWRMKYNDMEPRITALQRDLTEKANLASARMVEINRLREALRSGGSSDRIRARNRELVGCFEDVSIMLYEVQSRSNELYGLIKGILPEQGAEYFIPVAAERVRATFEAARKNLENLGRVVDRLHQVRVR